MTDETPPASEAFEQQFLAADELGIRLEIVGDLPIWEPQPLYRHQKHVVRIANSIRTEHDGSGGCACIAALDVYIRFPNGLKRPDISIFCQEPDEDDQDRALTMIPEAVIEVVSRGFEAKDFQVGPPFYLSQGVRDVVVFDPATLMARHIRPPAARRHVSPVDTALECGCVVTA